ncbi:hypothetical protein GCK32_022355, partial [Trichostrongylus colubriformis]
CNRFSIFAFQVRINENNLDIIGRTFGIIKPRSKILQQGLKNFTLIHFVQNLREKNLLLDYQLTSDPFVQNGAIAMLAKGEISWYVIVPMHSAFPLLITRIQRFILGIWTFTE